MTFSIFAWIRSVTGAVQAQLCTRSAGCAALQLIPLAHSASGTLCTQTTAAIARALQVTRRTAQRWCAQLQAVGVLCRGGAGWQLVNVCAEDDTAAHSSSDTPDTAHIASDQDDTPNTTEMTPPIIIPTSEDLPAAAAGGGGCGLSEAQLQAQWSAAMRRRGGGRCDLTKALLVRLMSAAPALRGEVLTAVASAAVRSPLGLCNAILAGKCKRVQAGGGAGGGLAVPADPGWWTQRKTYAPVIGAYSLPPLVQGVQPC